MVTAEKAVYANTMATLLCLDRGMEKELMKLSIDTLAKMYYQYLDNAKHSNNAIERAYAYKQDPATCRNKDQDSAIKHAMDHSD